MINFSLLMTSRSMISLDALWDTSLPAVVSQLSDRGYSVEQDHMLEAAGRRGLVKKFPVRPGPATLTAARNDTGDGSIEFVLDGASFGRSTGAARRDAVLWMQLVGLGVQFSEAYAVESLVSDPDFPAGLP